MSEHTKEKWMWHIAKGVRRIRTLKNFHLIGTVERKEDCERIVACVNACNLIPNESLYKMAKTAPGVEFILLKKQRDKLLEALIHSNPYCIHTETHVRNCKLIAECENKESGGEG